MPVSAVETPCLDGVVKPGRQADRQHGTETNQRDPTNAVVHDIFP
jgi:hypothetical protein